LRALALAHRGLPSDLEGAIPPKENWIGVRREPASQPTIVTAASNVRVNQDASGYDQNEFDLSSSPTNPLNLIGGGNDYRTGNVKCGWYASQDGGLTWTDGVLPESTFPYQGDPTVAHCADGSAIYVCLSFTGAYQPHGLFSYRTTDGGQTWSNPATILNRQNGFPFADKEWVWCDPSPSSPNANRAYVSWTDFGFSQSPILLKYSSNGGSTWSANVRVSDGSNVQGSVIASSRGGTVYVAWADANRVGFDRSTDGAQTFGGDSFPSSVVPIANDPVFRRNSFPTMDVDRTTGPHQNNIYIAWSDNRNGDPDILLVRSTNGGTTWSAPVRVNDDALANGADQFFPWLSVDPNGRVIVTFLDRRRSPGGRPYEVWGAVSRDGGQSFDSNFLVSDASSNGALNGFIGDYTGLTATATTLHALWPDLRAGTGETDAYSDRFPNTFRYDEVDGLAWTSKDDLDFVAQDARFGADLEYDVASGLLSELIADAGFTRASCASNDWPQPPFVDVRVPPESDAYWYLVRATGPNGVGTYGDGSPARPNVRDALDGTIASCP
ncbi:MAG TPA: sialidase family protein, partial [Candidatus Polarisedimenticolaceae bacterium]